MSPSILVLDDNKELVALLTSLFEGAGYSVYPAFKGKQAIELARAERPAVAVVDVLLPDMLGYNVAEALRANQPDIKLVFVSGVFKGSRHSEETLRRFPGATYLEKPFDAKQLLTTIGELIPPHSSKSRPPVSSVSGEFDVDIDTDIDEAEDAMELTGNIRISGLGSVTAELKGQAMTAAKTPAGQPAPGARPPPRDKPASTGLTPGRPGKKGELRDNLAGLFTAFYLSKETGELYCQKGQVKKVVYFEKGHPVFALSNLAADRFGNFLVRVGKIKPEAMADAAVVAAASNRRTGDVLVERGLLDESERLYFIAQQVKAIIYSLFGWESGQYVMAFREKARAESIKLDVFPGTMIMRGIKKLYKPERLERLVPLEQKLMPGQMPSYQLNEIDLAPWEVQLVPKIDGTRTNAEIIALAKRADTEVRAFLASMLALELLQPVA